MKSKSMLAREKMLPPFYLPLLSMLEQYGLTIEDEPDPAHVGYGRKLYHVAAYQQHGMTTHFQYIGQIHTAHDGFGYGWQIHLNQGFGATPRNGGVVEGYEFGDMLYRWGNLITRYGCALEDLNGVLFYRGLKDNHRRYGLGGNRRTWVLPSLKQAAEAYKIDMPGMLKEHLLTWEQVTLPMLRTYEAMPEFYVRDLFNLDENYFQIKR